MYEFANVGAGSHRVRVSVDGTHFFDLVRVRPLPQTLPAGNEWFTIALVSCYYGPRDKARNLARTMKGYLGWSVAIATAGSLAGIMISNALPVPSGGAIVLALAGLFFLTMGIGWIRGRAE